MRQLMIATFALAALSSGAAAYARTAHPAKQATKVEFKKTPATRAEKARRQIAADLHLRGSNIPPAFSPTGAWSR
jgi:hypothetical protein